MKRSRFVKDALRAFMLLASLAVAPAFSLGCGGDDGGDVDEAVEELKDEADDAKDEIEDEIDDRM